MLAMLMAFPHAQEDAYLWMGGAEGVQALEDGPFIVHRVPGRLQVPEDVCQLRWVAPLQASSFDPFD